MTTPTPHPVQLARPRWGLPSGIGLRLLLLITLALLPMLLLLAWVYTQRYDTRRTQALQTELEVAQGVSALFNAYVNDVQREAFVLAEAISSNGTFSTARTNRLLTVTAAQYDAVAVMNWVSPAGRVLASSVPSALGTDLGDREYFRALVAGQRWVLSDLYPETRIGTGPVFIIAHGARDPAERLRGAVVVGIDPSQLGQVALTRRRPAAGAYAIFDRRGVLVYRSPGMDLSWEARTGWAATDPVLREVLRTRKPATGIARLGSDGAWMVARTPIAQTGWVAGAGRPVDVALDPIRDALVQDALLALLVTALAVGLATLIGWTIIRPLHQLQGDVRAFGEGDLAHRATVVGPTEVAQVAQGFNQMADQIAAFQGTLEEQVRQRTAELEMALQEMETFSYSVAHDLRSPLRAMDGYSRYLLEHTAERLDARSADYLGRIRGAAQRMGRLIDDLLNLAQVGRTPVRRQTVDASALATEVLAELRARDPERKVYTAIAPNLIVCADRNLLRIVLVNLLGNAWKFTRQREDADITMGMMEQDGVRVLYVRDNGAGFDMAYVNKLFQPFHRLHTEAEFPGTGIGLALVQRVIQRHGGRIWAEGAVDQGATIYFTLGENAE